MTRKSPAIRPGKSAFSSFFDTKEELLPGLTLCCTRAPAQPTACLALLDLTLLAERLSSPLEGRSPETLLSPAELGRYAGYTYPKRQCEWLGGRLACKFAALHLAAPPGHVDMAALSVLPAPGGAPLLTCPSLPDWSPPAVSISHSDRYAVAMAVQAESCGVDLQKTTRQTLRVADRFSNPAEVTLLRQVLPELDEVQHLTLLWTAKEALKKGLLQDQPVLFQGVTLHSLTRDQCSVLRLRYPRDGGRPAAIAAMALDDYFLAYTIDLSHA